MIVGFQTAFWLAHDVVGAYAEAWLKMNEEGICTPVTIDKHRLSSLLRVPMRDLRMLEPNFSNSYSAAILCRERCMVRAGGGDANFDFSSPKSLPFASSHSFDREVWFFFSFLSVA